MLQAAKNGHQVIEPVDVSMQVVERNSVQVVFGHHPALFPPEGLFLVAELVRLVSTEALMNRVPTEAALEPEASATNDSNNDALLAIAKTLVVKVCGACGKPGELRRCSRCHMEWYCNISHQKQHWDHHRSRCVAPTPQQEAVLVREEAVAEAALRVAAAAAKKANDDIVEMETCVSLECPLSGGRIIQAARGEACTHERCFDLKTFLTFAESSGAWQCPVCQKPLPFADVRVNAHMNKILQDTGEETLRIRMHPSGAFTAVDERKARDTQRKRKRKRPATEVEVVE